MAGIYAADGDRLSLAATFPQLREAELRHGGVIKGVLATRRAAPPAQGPRQSTFLAPAAGLDALVTTLETQLLDGSVAVRTNTAAAAVLPANNGYDVRLTDSEILPADVVIVATPAFVAAELIAGIDPRLARELAAIAHASTAIVTLAYRRDQIPHALDGHGYVVPRCEGGPVLACTWSSRKWENRAPAGYELLRVFLGRAGQEDVLAGSDDGLIALARREVAARLGVTAAPALTRVARWPRGMPQYLLGHLERVARIEAMLNAHPGLFLAGNAYRGVGLPDCIASGERAAESAIVYLRHIDQPVAGERVHSAQATAS
jgi:oxygen-dependent protoporphyrinogen oxidase